MQLSSYLCVALISLLSLSSAVPTQQGHPEMNVWEISLDEYMNDNNSSTVSTTQLEKRKQVKACGVTFQVTYDRCFAAATFAGTLGVGIAQIMSSKSDARSCSPVEFHDDNFQYAVRAEGTCHTTAQRTTIQGALDKFVDDDLPDSVCGIQCLKVTHGGDWRGYIVFGAGTYDWERYLDMCKSVSKFGTCDSGGKKDVP